MQQALADGMERGERRIPSDPGFAVLSEMANPRLSPDGKGRGAHRVVGGLRHSLVKYIRMPRLREWDGPAGSMENKK